jgi:hypothetical protein
MHYCILQPLLEHSIRFRSGQRSSNSGGPVNIENKHKKMENTSDGALGDTTVLVDYVDSEDKIKDSLMKLR